MLPGQEGAGILGSKLCWRFRWSLTMSENDVGAPACIGPPLRKVVGATPCGHGKTVRGVNRAAVAHQLPVGSVLLGLEARPWAKPPGDDESRRSAAGVAERWSGWDCSVAQESPIPGSSSNHDVRESHASRHPSHWCKSYSSCLVYFPSPGPACFLS